MIETDITMINQEPPDINCCS